MKFIAYLSVSLIVLCSCMASSPPSAQHESVPQEKKTKEELAKYSRAYFASGCFWCVEAVFESVKGVEEAVSGYSGGHTTDPTYRSIGTGTTGHAEAVEVYYDAAVVDYNTLLKVFYGSHDPTTVNGQAPDFGTQYRSVIFYQNEKEKELAESYKKSVGDSGDYQEPITTEIVELEKFYPAEDYHQDYERLNPNQSYVRAVSIPRLNRFKNKYPDLLK